MLAPITVHQSQWPASLAAQLRQSFLSGRINHKFHYQSPRQVRQWLRLHESYSPARQAEEFRTSYEPAFEAIVKRLGGEAVQLLGLGCGGGQKEAVLLASLTAGRRRVRFTATDVSAGMVITALQAAWDHIAPEHCSGLVCDLALAEDLATFFDAQRIPGGRRVLTFFGMIPNFEPKETLAVLQRLMRPGDLLVSSANLAPGSDYRHGVEQVLPQYDNAPTRDWLSMLLEDAGIGRDNGNIRFSIETAGDRGNLLRIAATFGFQRSVTAVVEEESLEFERGLKLRLFFSLRHTPQTLEQQFASAGLNLAASWISDSGEEGVFLAEAQPTPAGR